MCYGPQVARRALGLVLVTMLSLACAPAQPTAPSGIGPEAAWPPLVLPTSTPAFRLPSPPVSALPPASSPAPAPAQGLAPSLWIGGEGVLTALGPEGWQTFELSGIVRDIAVDAAGNAIVAPGLRVCNGRLLRDLLPRAPGGEQDAVAIDPQGRIWVGFYGGIAVLDGGRWRVVPMPDANASTQARTVRDLAIDSRGTVWVATGQGVASYDGQSWQQHNEKSGPGPVTVAHLLVDRQGSVWVAHEKGLSALYGGAWTHYGLDVVGFVRGIAAGADGRMVVAGPQCGIALLDNGLRQVVSDEGADLALDRISALAADGLGRIWVGTALGLSVSDGGRWVTYQEANSGLGGDGVSALATGATALEGLPAIGAIRYGSLSGQVTMHRRPLPGVRVALCSEILLGQGTADGPCQGSCFSRLTRTGVDGRYLFEQIPLGHYAVAAEVAPGRWVASMRVVSAMRYAVREGQTTVVDTIDVGEQP